MCDKTVWSFIIFFLICAQVIAEPSAPSKIEPTDSNLDFARQQYDQGDYAQAKFFYEKALTQAQAQGKPVRLIYYNLGSVCYKLKQFEQSGVYFNKLVNDEKLAALAYYNLALIENKQGNNESAIHFFNRSKAVSTDLQFSTLVDQQLLKLKTHAAEKALPGKDKTTKQKDWHAYIYLSPGHDSNINFAPLEVASNQSGDFLQLIGLFDKVIAGSASDLKQPALLFTSSVFLSNYFSSDFNDYNLYDIGLRYLLPVNQWRNSIELNLKQSTYGHTDYQQIYAVTFKTRRRFSGGDTLRLRYRYEQIDSRDPLYDYLEGDRQKLRLGYQFKWPQDAVYLWYELELNDRQNTVTRNYSPTRNTARLRYEKKFNPSNSAYVEVEYRHSEYEPTATQDRLDKRNGYLFAYVYDIAADWQVLARLSYRNNRSTDSLFSYDRHVALLTLRKTF